jgi:crossover junction endodeoxyribonuclease RusA
MWGQSGHRKFLKKVAHDFRLKVQEEVIAKSAKIEGRLAIFIALYAPTRRNYDIDNRCKAVLDALQHSGVYLDDEQIDFIWIVRRPIVKGGMCKIVLIEHENVGEILNNYEGYV